MIFVFVSATVDEAEATLKYAVIVGHHTLKIRYIIICLSNATRD